MRDIFSLFCCIHNHAGLKDSNVECLKRDKHASLWAIIAHLFTSTRNASSRHQLTMSHRSQLVIRMPLLVLCSSRVHSLHHFCLCTEFVHNTLIKCTEILSDFWIWEGERRIPNYGWSKVFPVIQLTTATLSKKNDANLYQTTHNIGFFTWNAAKIRGFLFPSHVRSHFRLVIIAINAFSIKRENLQSLIHLGKNNANETSNCASECTEDSTRRLVSYCSYSIAENNTSARKRILQESFQTGRASSNTEWCFCASLGKTFILVQHKMWKSWTNGTKNCTYILKYE